MKHFNFKYDIGDKVYSIGQYQKPVHIKCKACDGVGRIELLDGTSSNCPKCGYQRVSGYITEYEPQKWQIDQLLTIGQQRVEINKAGRKNKSEVQESYMCEETGVGSGSVHYVEKLFATEEEALAECEILNTKEASSK